MTHSKSHTPPIAKIVNEHTSIHGYNRIDSYAWLKNRKDKDVIPYLEAENTYAKEMLEDTNDLQDQLYKEMRQRIKEDDNSVPVQRGNFYYYHRTEENLQYPIYCRNSQDSTNKDTEEILLNLNDLADGKDYLKLGSFKISPNHQMLAYTLDETGGETYDLYIKDLHTGNIIDENVKSLAYSLEWASDNNTIFYTVYDHVHRPYEVKRHTLLSSIDTDTAIYNESDDTFTVGISKSKDGNYIFLYSQSKVTSEIWFLDSTTPENKFSVIHQRERMHEYDVDHRDGYFYIVTNDNAINFKLVKTSVTTPNKSNWCDVLAYDEKIKLDDIDIFENHIALYERQNGSQQIRIYRFSDETTHSIDFSEPVFSLSGGANPEFYSSKLRFSYTSMVTPDTTYDYDMDEKTLNRRKQREVLGNYDPTQYESIRLFAHAADGESIPISMVVKKDFHTVDIGKPMDLYLIGYGSYGMCYDPYFSSNFISLLDRGIAVAITHIRGGGEMGRPWYENGKKFKKKNTFTDFIASATYLIDSGYTSKDQLVIQGGSAGGLLMGAVLNLQPDIFKAAIADVPFVDVINTMLDDSIPLTTLEYDEWGNPNEKDVFDYIMEYSPYDNVEAKAYPNILVTSGLNDPRVAYWEPAKWVAKLRTFKTDHNMLLFKTNMGAGHGGASGRFDYLKEIAFKFSFLLKVLKKL